MGKEERERVKQLIKTLLGASSMINLRPDVIERHVRNHKLEHLLPEKSKTIT